MDGPQPPPQPDPAAPAPRSVAPAKTALRDQLLAARRRRPPAEVADAARALAGHLLALPELRRAATVAAYVAVGGEPGTSALLAALLQQRRRVLLPLVQPDLDLDWAVHAGEGSLYPAARGLLEPTGPPLGRDAVAQADVVLVPGLAVDDAGLRLGRGGGCYDRALARVPVGTLTCVLLYPDEVGRAVPAEPHDRPVRAAATADGVRRFG